MNNSQNDINFGEERGNGVLNVIKVLNLKDGRSESLNRESISSWKANNPQKNKVCPLVPRREVTDRKETVLRLCVHDQPESNSQSKSNTSAGKLVESSAPVLNPQH